MEYVYVQHALFAMSDKKKCIKDPWYNNNNNDNNNNDNNDNNESGKKFMLVDFKMKIISEIKPNILFSWPASNFLEHFYSYLSPFLTFFSS